MANFQNGINVTGSTSYINIYTTTENTSSLGNLWWDGNNLSISGYVSSTAAGSQLISSKNTSGGTGTLNAALAFGGGCNPIVLTCTEEYDGSSWTAGGALITGRRCLAGAGTQTAGLAFGGSINDNFCNETCTEEYNGSSWTTGGTKIYHSGVGGAGTQNAALAMGGVFFGTLSCTEEYNGTSWATGGALITARCNFSSFGTQNSAVAAGGCGNSDLLSIENYDGSSWAESSTLPSLATCSAGAGTNSSSGLIIGGCQNPTNTTVISQIVGKKIIK